MERVRDQINSVFKQLSGDFVVPKNAYEKNFCDILGWLNLNGRYYDAYNTNTYIEIKKGQGGMHFDMVRYAEIVLGTGAQNTATVFFKWNKIRKCVDEAYVIDTNDLIKFLRIDEEMAKLYLKIYNHVPRGVNILASATARDLREIATHVITKDGIKFKHPLIIRLRRSRRGLYEFDETSDSSAWPLDVYIF